MDDYADILELPPVFTPRPVFDRPKGRLCEEEIALLKPLVLERLSAGVEDRKQIYTDLRISRKHLVEWCKTDVEFATQLQSASEHHHEAMADALLTLHDKHINPAMAKVESDNRKWWLGIQDRQRFGTKVEVSNAADAGLIDVLKAAISRIPRPALQPDSNLRVIEHEATLDPADILALPSNDD